VVPNNKTNLRLVSLVSFLVLLTAWELSSRSGLISTTFFPPPLKIWESFMKLISNGELQAATQDTMIRFILGGICGSTAGAVFGLMMGWWPRLNYYLAPWIAAFYPIPKIAIFPLLMIIFGIGEGSKFVAILLSSFFPMLITTLAGVQQINRIYFEVGQNYGIRGRKVFTHILLPGSLPSILAGLRMAMNTGFVIAISVEVISAKSGLGVLLWFGWQTFRVSELYAVLLVISLIGILLNYLLNNLTTWLVPWMGE
jgi:NitT/TauT family transport system permease protein